MEGRQRSQSAPLSYTSPETAMRQMEMALRDKHRKDAKELQEIISNFHLQDERICKEIQEFAQDKGKQLAVLWDILEAPVDRSLEFEYKGVSFKTRKF